MGERLKILLMNGAADAVVSEMYSRNTPESIFDPSLRFREMLVQRLDEGGMTAQNNEYEGAWNWVETDTSREAARGE